jgi:hypothetical protein
MTKKMETITVQGGAQYAKVDTRVKEFRKDFPQYEITTDIVEITEDVCICKTYIRNEEGRTIATGYAREVKEKNTRNQTSYLEICETSAVGRALAFFGYCGDGIATTEDVERAKHKQAVLLECRKRCEECRKIEDQQLKQQKWAEMFEYARMQGVQIKYEKDTIQLL